MSKQPATPGPPVLPEASAEPTLGNAVGKLLSDIFGNVLNTIAKDMEQRAEETRVAREANRPIRRLQRCFDRWFGRFSRRSTAPQEVATPQSVVPSRNETAP